MFGCIDVIRIFNGFWVIALIGCCLKSGCLVFEVGWCAGDVDLGMFRLTVGVGCLS